MTEWLVSQPLYLFFLSLVNPEIEMWKLLETRRSLAGERYLDDLQAFFSGAAMCFLFSVMPIISEAEDMQANYKKKK